MIFDCLNQNNPIIHDVKIGEHIFAFTRRMDGRYVLAADLVVAGKKINSPDDDGYRYGQYNVWGDKQSSLYFDTFLGPDIEPLLRSLFPLSKESKKENFPVGLSF